MEHSPTIGEIAKALGQFQYMVGTVNKDAINPFFKSKYASFENITTHIKDPLAKNKLTYSQFPDGDGLTTILMHESGEWIKATAKLTIKDMTPQGQGSAITYMKRYALSAALGIATDEDDDANSASAPKAAAKPAPKPTPKLDQKTQSEKDRIFNQLRLLDLPRATLAECEKSVLEATNLDLVPINYDRIGDVLEELLDAKDAAQ